MNLLSEKLNNILKSNLKVWLFLFLVSLIFRMLSFFYSVIEHDESTYLIISNAINNGAYLYTDVVDTKPPGIFLIFSFIQLVFGKSIFMLRLFGSFILSISAFLLFKIGKQLNLKSSVSLFSGVSYIIIFSAYRFGLGINTELFFSFFTIAGFYCFLKAFKRKKILLWLIGGSLVGFGFITKYVVLAGYGAFAVYFLYQSETVKKALLLIPRLILSTIGLFIPFILVHVYFYINGRFDDFYEIVYQVTSNYSSTLTLKDSLTFFFNFHLSYLPFIILFYSGLFHAKIDKKIKVLSLTWFVFAWVMVILPGKQFKHYYLQLLPSLCFLIPLAFEHLLTKKQSTLKTKTRVIASSLLIVFIVAVINQSYFWTRMDTPRELASTLEEYVDDDDLMIVDKHLHLTYYLLDLSPPSKYVHPTLIFNHTKAFGMDTETEMNKMLDKKPKFIIYHKSYWYFEKNERINREYHFFKQIGKAKILKLNS